MGSLSFAGPICDRETLTYKKTVYTSLYFNLIWIESMNCEFIITVFQRKAGRYQFLMDLVEKNGSAVGYRYNKGNQMNYIYLKPF